jgi:prepilin-type N-terminal cleavage/methylation domain-containing protein
MQIAKRKQKGFTLLEILLVIAAIGILAAIVLVAINPAKQLAQARNAERRSEVNTIYKALEQYLIDTGSYPTGITTAVQDICINGNITNCVNLGVLVPDYIAVIPIDPGGVAYRVRINTSNNRVSVFAINAELGQGIGINDQPWTPAQLGSSLALWLDAADSSTIMLNGSTVSQWNDKSGNARHVLQATAANQPSYVANSLNSKPGIDWGSVLNDKQLSNSSISYTMNRAYGVAYWDGPSMFPNYNALLAFGGAGGGNSIQANPGGVNLFGGTTLFLNGSTSSTNSALPTIAEPFVFASGQDTTGTRNTFIIGGDGNTDRGWIGLIYEVILSVLPLSLDDRQKLEGYLAWKWGLTDKLPTNHPYKWDGTLFGGVNITDTDARTYIAAVETADGQSLENATRLAIQNFITGAKADGIWDAIKSSNILAGARTLNGALVPLKGTAPTNFNFVSGDYNRKTGLKGNGSTKYLNSNRNNNADPQNSKHLAAYVTSQTGGVDRRIMGSSDVGSDGYSLLAQQTSANLIYIGLNRVSSYTPTAVGSIVTGFFGAVRSSSTTETARAFGTNYERTVASTAPSSSAITIYQASGASTDARLTYYSIGEALDLALLDVCVTKLMTNLGNAIP